MSEDITVAIISASSAVTVAIVALVVNVIWMGRAFAQQGKRLNGVETRLANIESHIVSFATDIARLKERAGIP
jgi:hypothetical protein